MSFVGTLAGAQGADSWPAAFRSCVAAGATFQIDGCARPHRVELLGWLSAPRTDGVGFPDTPDALAAGCVQFAAARIGAPDPTFGGRIRIVAAPLTGAVTGIPSADPATSMTMALPDCYLEVVGPGLLMDSLIGNADRPLPLQP